MTRTESPTAARASSPSPRPRPALTPQFTSSPRPSTRWSARSAAEARRAYAFIAPALLLLLLLILLPTAAVVALSCVTWTVGTTTFRFAGAAHYRAVLADVELWRALGHTVLFGLMVVAGSVTLGLLTAIAIEQERRWRTALRTLHLLPFVATLSATALVWESLLHPMVGLVNWGLQQAGAAGANWLHDRHTVLPAMALIAIWQNFGYATTLFVAGLRSIPRELYEAAAIDGIERRVDVARLITVPMLGPSIVFAMVLMAIRALQAFDMFALLTQGGPHGASNVLVYVLYRENFEFFRMAQGAVVTVLFLVLSAGLTFAQVTLMHRRTHYR